MTVTTPTGPAALGQSRRGRWGAGSIWPVVAILVLLLIAVGVRQPDFYDPPALLAFLKRSAPLIILAAGQYFVIVAGDFDLSVGSLVTAEVVIAARLIDGDPARDLAGGRPGARLRPAGRPGQRAGHHAAAGAVVHHHARHVPDPGRRGLHLDGRLAPRRAVRGVPACSAGAASKACPG